MLKKVSIKCPSCSTKGDIQIADDFIKNTSRGLLAVNITKDLICSHSFIAYIDKNLNVRDYFIADFCFEIPEIPIERFEETKEKFLVKKAFDIDLIKLNLPPTQLSFILKAIFSKQKVMIISNQDFLYGHLHDFFKYISYNSFQIDINFISEEEYNQNKKKYKDSMVFHGIYIVNNVKKIINPKKLFFEKLIVNSFFSNNQLELTYIIFRNEILKIYKLSKSIVEFINDSKKKNEEVNILKIGNQLESEYHIKINTAYLSFLIDIVKDYFKVEVPRVRDSFIRSF